MAGVNKAIIIGNLGGDPELRHASGGAAVVNFSVATSEEWKDKNSGEKREKTEWHRVVAFGRLAEICGEYLEKGKKVYIEGRIQTRDWEDKEGVKRYTTEIVAGYMQMLGGGSDGRRNEGGSRRTAHGNGHGRTRGHQSHTGPGAKPGGPPKQRGYAYHDDDIPF